MTSERIDHTAEAWSLLERARVNSREDVTVAAAQVHATLAVAEQLRIANRIALAQVRIVPNDLPVFRAELFDLHGPNPDAAHVEIREGLGL